MLRVSGLACQKGERLLFRDLSFTLAMGQIVRIAGHNGCGKTSLLRLLCGLAAPTAGEILWAEQSIHTQREAWQRQLLYCGHSAALHERLSAQENLHFAAATHGHSDAAACRAALAQVGLSAQADLPASVLSQGQRRRVGLARLYLPTTPPVWLLDEPFAALDQAAITQLEARLMAHREQGGSVLLTTHQALGIPADTLNLAEFAV